MIYVFQFAATDLALTYTCAFILLKIVCCSIKKVSVVYISSDWITQTVRSETNYLGRPI